MKKLLVTTLTLMMLAPTSVQAKGKMVNVVTKIGKNTVTYNKDGLVSKYDGNRFVYHKGKLTAITALNHSLEYKMTYTGGRVRTINKKKVKCAYNKSIHYTDKDNKYRKSAKGTLYSFGQDEPFTGDAQYLYNRKGQLMLSFAGYTNSYYTYDAHGNVTKGVEFDLATAVGPDVFSAKNTYKGSLLTSRIVKGVYDGEYTNRYKMTYKKMRVQDVNAVKKQQTVLLNNLDLIHLVF